MVSVKNFDTHQEIYVFNSINCFVLQTLMQSSEYVKNIDTFAIFINNNVSLSKNAFIKDRIDDHVADELT